MMEGAANQDRNLICVLNLLRPVAVLSPALGKIGEGRRVSCEARRVNDTQRFQLDAAHRGRTAEQTSGGRKIQDARLLVGALDLTRVPRPPAGVLARV